MEGRGIRSTRGIVAGIALIAGLLALGASASADHLEVCQDTEATPGDAELVEVCVVDASSGELNDDSEEPCEDYRAFSGAEASSDSEVGEVWVEAGARERCWYSSWSNQEWHNEEIFAATGADTELAETGESIAWRADYRGCVLYAYYWIILDGEYESYANSGHDCPDETTPPNPGWGTLHP